MNSDVYFSSHLFIIIFYLFSCKFNKNKIKFYLKKKYRKQCFTTEFFKGCMEALQLHDEVNVIKSYIKIVNGAEPIQI